MTQDEAKFAIKKAINSLIKVKQLPISLLTIRELSDGSFNLLITNNKLKAAHPDISYNFTCTIFKEIYTEFSTKGIDVIANIPADMPDNEKLVLRIAYMIVVKYTSHILEVFKNYAGNTFINLTNAMIWFKEL